MKLMKFPLYLVQRIKNLSRSESFCAEQGDPLYSGFERGKSCHKVRLDPENLSATGIPRKNHFFFEEWQDSFQAPSIQSPTPKQIAVSATLKVGKVPTSIKSVTRPSSTRSTVFPTIPPASIAEPQRSILERNFPYSKLIQNMAATPSI